MHALTKPLALHALANRERHIGSVRASMCFSSRQHVDVLRAMTRMPCLDSQPQALKSPKVVKHLSQYKKDEQAAMLADLVKTQVCGRMLTYADVC